MSKELVKELNLKIGDTYKNFKTLKTYRVVEIKEEEGKVKLEGIETRNLTTTLKALSTNYYLEEEVKEEEVKEEEVKEEEVKEEEVKEENKKTLVEEALEEAGLSSKLGKIGEKVEEESIEDPIEASIEEPIEETIEETKDPIEALIENLETYIEDNKRDIILGKEVLVLKKDFSTLKGKIVSIGDFTFKLLVDNKEEIIFFKDLIGTYSKDIDFNKLSSYLTSIKGIKPEENKKDKKPNKDTKKVTKKDKEEGIITLRDIIEEIVREKLLILDLEYNPNNTFKNIRKKIRKRGELTKSLRLEGYTYSFRIENKNLIKEELLKILA